MLAGLVALTIIIAIALVVIAVRQRRFIHGLDALNQRLGAPPLARQTEAVEQLGRTVERVKRHEDDLGAERVRLEAALSAVTQGVVVYDVAGREVFRNRFAQPFASTHESDALVEAALRELIPQSLRGHHLDREVDLFGPPPRSYLVHSLPLDNDRGERLGAIAVIDDVTEQQRIDAVRRDFVANISHELKTPIGALIILSDALAGESDPAVIGRLADRMCGEVERVNQIVDDLLTLTRIEGEGVGEWRPVTIADVVDAAVDRVRTAADKHHVAITIDAIDPALAVEGDRSQLVAVVANLLDNAVKYSDEGGGVRVRADAHNGAVELSVQDRGVGIPARDLERIFERFYRVDRARSRQTGGTGLGLSIVRHAARNHGGDVQVESREGEGSTFRLRLPRLGQQSTPR